MYIKDLKDIQTQSKVNLYNSQSTIHIDGTGDIPCLTIGLGSLLQKTLSEDLKNRLKVYSTDLYWLKQSSPIDFQAINIETICRDIIEVANQLDLSNYYLLGHSVFGGLAIETAKYQPTGLQGVIGIGATPGWDAQIIAFKNSYFEEFASQERKKRFMDMQKHYQNIKKESDSLASIAAYHAESAKYFAEPVNLQQMEALWADIDCDDAMINHLFNTLLPNYTFEENVNNIKVPVLIAGGQKDYDSVPLEIWNHYSTPKKTTFLDCGPVGHWPHLEAPEVFDKGVLKWIAELC